MVVAVPNRVARCHYFLRKGGKAVIGYTLKCASTFVVSACQGVNKIGIYEAYQFKKKGADVALVVRHPLDRMVSNYVFWTTTNLQQIGNLLGNEVRRNELTLPSKFSTGTRVSLQTDDIKALTFEEFYELTQMIWNPHWADQTYMHTYGDELVPNLLYPMHALALCKAPKKNATHHAQWESYFTPEFREKMEERWKDDIALYEKACEEWDGERPKYF